MTAAAFSAAYSDFKLIKTRGVVSISFEIPLQDVDLALQVLGGMPDAAKERWFGIAALNLGSSSTVEHRTVNATAAGSIPASSAKLNAGVTVAPDLPVEAAGLCGESPDRPHLPRKVAADKRLAQRAGMLCSDPVFQQFLLERQHITSKNEPEAAEFIRRYCGVESRAELQPGEPAGMVWTSLHSEFEAWRMV